MPFGNRKLEWKIGEPGADEICDKNVRLMDMVFDRLVKKCGNPFCGFPISAIREENFATPEYGDVCATCHDLHSALIMTNTLLKNTNYFRFYHAEWLKQKREEAEKHKNFRRRLGMDDKDEHDGIT